MALTVSETREPTTTTTTTTSPQNPFLPSDAQDFPSLKRIDVPEEVRSRFLQQMEQSPIQIPWQCYRNTNTRLREYRPAPGCPTAFKNAYAAFCSARRTMAAQTTSEGETLFISETAELLAHSRACNPAFGSLPPRSLAVSLVVNSASSRSMSTLSFLDGIATLSECKTDSGLPATTCVRYSVYGGEATYAVERVLARDAFGIKQLTGISLVVRWVDSKTDDNNNNGVVVRTECAPLEMAYSSALQTPHVIQTQLIKLANAFKIELPQVVFKQPEFAKECCYEFQVAKCSSELRAILHAEGPLPEGLGETRLERVPGCFLRLSPIPLGLPGVTSPANIHALLLCEEGFQKRASEFVRRFREGLPPPDGADVAMRLHSVAVQTERVDLNAMVSLYAPGGKPGEPLKTDGNWVFKHTVSIVPLESLFGKFFVMGCDLTSSMPGNSAFGKFMHCSVQECLDLVQKTFPRLRGRRLNDNTVSEMNKLCSTTTSPEQVFEMNAMGIDINCKRITIGDALSYLTAMHENRGGLFNMLMSVASTMGLRASLNQVFLGCAEAFQANIKEDTASNELVCKLKRVADAALLLNCSKRARTTQTFAPSDKVRLLFKSLGLKTGNNVVKIDSFVTVPRSEHTAHSAWKAVCECAEVDMKCEVSNSAMKVLKQGSDFMNALSAALGSASCFKGEDKRAFLMIHGNNMGGALVLEVQHSGILRESTSGNVFDAHKPAVLLVKLLSDTTCLLTPMVSP